MLYLPGFLALIALCLIGYYAWCTRADERRIRKRLKDALGRK